MNLIKFPLGLYVLLVLFAAPAWAREAPEVEAGGEHIRGLWNGQVAEFRGIPFARPPRGELRWRAPRAPEPRSGVVDATAFAAACVQSESNVKWYAGVAEAFGHESEVAPRPVGTGEDCLYLNVWTPNIQPLEPLPVMVFVHGGSNVGGWSYEPNYIGNRLAEQGVVVVTTSYRLGALGFFAHSGLDNGPGEAVANFALLDLQMAFDWVGENIDAFGGDPGRITAFGESSGALNLLDLLLASAYRGELERLRFQRVILQSLGGELKGRQTLAEERAAGRELITLIDPGGPMSLAQMRQIPATELIEARAQLDEEHYHDAVIDGQIIPVSPAAALADSSFDGIELIIGTNADEWLMYQESDDPQTALEQWISKYPSDRQAEFRDAVADEPDARRALDRLVTARSMLCPSLEVAESVNANGGRAWVYRFERRRPGPGGERLGAYHGAELPYVFNQHDAWLPTAAEDRALTVHIQQSWLQFARDGIHGTTSSWPLYAPKSASVQILDHPVRLARPVDHAICQLLNTVGEDKS